MSKPCRVRLSRAKGWRMPPNTVKVDRTTKWGNPFIVGKHGDRAYCVKLYALLMGGYLCLTIGNGAEQQAARKYVERNRNTLKGKNLACWCSDGPCHADILLEIARNTR